MPTAKLHNLARMTTATTGTGTVTLGAAVAGHLTFANAGVADGSLITYAVADGANSEIGRGTYAAAGPTLTRTSILRSTNGGLPLSLSGAAEVAVTAAAEDFDVNDFTAKTVPAAADLIWLHDASAADRRKMTLDHALKVINALAEDAAPDQANDFVVSYDASATAAKKVRGRNIGFPSGTKMLFVQTSAPTGWTKDTDQNDKALRIVSGTPGTGGTSPFSTVFGKTGTDAYTLTIADIPAHHHGPGGATNFWASLNGGGATDLLGTGGQPAQNVKTGTTDDTGGGGSHAHGMDIRVQYVDVIKATKD
jgi:hypothetical protein